jgi:hypothetical protein
MCSQGITNPGNPPVYVRILDKAALLINAVSNTDTAHAELNEDQWREISPLLDKWNFTGRLICRNGRVASFWARHLDLDRT